MNPGHRHPRTNRALETDRNRPPQYRNQTLTIFAAAVFFPAMAVADAAFFPAMAATDEVFFPAMAVTDAAFLPSGAVAVSAVAGAEAAEPTGRAFLSFSSGGPTPSRRRLNEKQATSSGEPFSFTVDTERRDIKSLNEPVSQLPIMIITGP